MFYLAFQGVQQLALLTEHAEVEVVVIVCDENLSSRVDPNTNRVIGDALSSNLAQEDTLIVEDLYAVGPVVADENLFFVVHHHTIRKLEVLGAAEFVQHIAHLIKDDDAHYLAFHDDNSTLVVNGHSSGMLQNVGTELPHELTILIVDLYLQT